MELKKGDEMNEKINQIAEHCDFYVGNEHYDKSYEEKQRLFIEKFAKLIIQECIDYCGENLSKTVGGALKIHFGVKE
jgi:uncharacterized protein YutE (UPF0331/DUF86 family)